MEQLNQTGLFAQGLMPVNQPSLVERYNACLKEIGLSKTSLNSFRVDGWGWSPEIAAERSDAHYLSHEGTANPYAIILSPLQKDLPVYFPFHSFDKHLMKVVFQVAEAQIADLTASTALWIDVDQEISTFREPRDLLMIDAITLRFHAAGGLMEQATMQRELVHRFNNQRMAWADRRLLLQISDSVKAHGDLRYRSLYIPDIPYTNTRSFHTRAFGGLYVFRDLPAGKPLLIMVDPGQRRLAEKEGYDHLEYSLQDPDLLPMLFRENLVDLQWTLYRDNPKPLRRLQDCLLMRSIAGEDPSAELTALTEGEVRRWMLQLTREGKLPELYHELDRLLLQLQRNQVVQLQSASPELTLTLTHPHRTLKESGWNTVRQLLVNLSSRDVVSLFEYDKAGFFDQYKTWPETFQRWVAQYLEREALPKT